MKDVLTLRCRDGHETVGSGVSTVIGSVMTGWGTQQQQQQKKKKKKKKNCLFAGCLTSQQHATVSQGQICSDYCTCCHTEIEVAER